jgi:hypothetical protein
MKRTADLSVLISAVLLSAVLFIRGPFWGCDRKAALRNQLKSIRRVFGVSIRH